MTSVACLFIFFFFNDTATTEIYTLSLHDALPISPGIVGGGEEKALPQIKQLAEMDAAEGRSEEHTSELQSQSNLVCRLLLEKKKKNKKDLKTRVNVSVQETRIVASRSRHNYTLMD